MTPAQVSEAMNGEAPLARSPGDDMEAKVANVGEYIWEGYRFRSLYYYDASGLALVALDWKMRPTDKTCGALLEHLIAAHGQPLRVSDLIIGKTVIWHDKANDNRVRVLVSLSAGICTLYIERLADYEAHDLANRGVSIDPPKRVN